MTVGDNYSFLLRKLPLKGSGCHCGPMSGFEQKRLRLKSSSEREQASTQRSAIWTRLLEFSCGRDCCSEVVLWRRAVTQQLGAAKSYSE